MGTRAPGWGRRRADAYERSSDPSPRDNEDDDRQEEAPCAVSFPEPLLPLLDLDLTGATGFEGAPRSIVEEGPLGRRIIAHHERSRADLDGAESHILK